MLAFSLFLYFNENVIVLAHTLSVFLSCFSKMAMLSFRVFTISAGFLYDLLNTGIFFTHRYLQYEMPKTNKDAQIMTPRRESSRYSSSYPAAVSLPFNPLTNVH